MPRLPIIQSDLDITICLPDSSLPAFYMEDYTVLGLRVGDLAEAVRVLEKNGIRICKSPGYNEPIAERKWYFLRYGRYCRTGLSGVIDLCQPVRQVKMRRSIILIFVEANKLIRKEEGRAIDDSWDRYWYPEPQGGGRR